MSVLAKAVECGEWERGCPGGGSFDWAFWKAGEERLEFGRELRPASALNHLETRRGLPDSRRLLYVHTVEAGDRRGLRCLSAAVCAFT